MEHNSVDSKESGTENGNVVHKVDGPCTITINIERPRNASINIPEEKRDTGQAKNFSQSFNTFNPLHSPQFAEMFGTQAPQIPEIDGGPLFNIKDPTNFSELVLPPLQCSQDIFHDDENNAMRNSYTVSSFEEKILNTAKIVMRRYINDIETRPWKELMKDPYKLCATDMMANETFTILFLEHQKSYDSVGNAILKEQFMKVHLCLTRILEGINMFLTADKIQEIVSDVFSVTVSSDPDDALNVKTQLEQQEEMYKKLVPAQMIIPISLSYSPYSHRHEFHIDDRLKSIKNLNDAKDYLLKVTDDFIKNIEDHVYFSKKAAANIDPICIAIETILDALYHFANIRKCDIHGKNISDNLLPRVKQQSFGAHPYPNFGVGHNMPDNFGLYKYWGGMMDRMGFRKDNPNAMKTKNLMGMFAPREDRPMGSTILPIFNEYYKPHGNADSAKKED